VKKRRVGHMIRALRERQGMTLRELARRAEIAHPYLSNLEREKQKNPSLDVLTRIARALDVPVSRLLGE
jgi:XRE family transcriptional regulator of biofilm formation